MDEEAGAIGVASFGALLQRLRLARGLTQAELAERGGLSVRGLSDLERGARRRARPETFARLVNALSLDADERAQLDRLQHRVPVRLPTKLTDAPVQAKALDERPRLSLLPRPPEPPGLPGPAAGPRVPGLLATVRGAAPTPNNLPIPPTPLIGRATELLQLEARLREPEARLVTLTGAGGVGKTRLALALGTALLDDFPDGVWFVSLATLSDPALVGSTIGLVLGLRGGDGTPIEAVLAAFLRRKTLLLIVDNFEHLLTAAPLLSGLLAQCALLKVVATSRAPLQLSGEYEFPIEPLELPSAGRALPLDALAGYAAVELFVERARAIRPRFSLTAENANSVVAICRRLDGLPLAIELATARIRVLPPKAMLARLQAADSGPLGLLSDGVKDLAPRQATLRATIAWSYQLLSPAEQALFRRLGVFVGDFDLEMVCAVVPAVGPLDLDLLDGIGSLVARTLVRSDESAGEPRFSLLETVRDFAREALREMEELAAAERAHASYFAALAGEGEQARWRWTGARQTEWLARLGHHLDDVRIAFDRLVAANEVELGLRLVAGLLQTWLDYGRVGEGRATCATILAITPESTRTIERGRVLASAGILAMLQGDFVAAAAQLEQGLAFSREIDDLVGVGRCLDGLGVTAARRGDLAAGRPLLEASLAAFRQAGDRQGAALALINLGFLARFEGSYAEARAHYEDALQVYRETGNTYHLGTVLFNLGDVLHKQGDDSSAISYVREGLRLMWKAGTLAWVVDMIELVPAVNLALGQAAKAVRLAGAGTALRTALGRPLPPLNRAERDQVLTACRQSLGELAFEQAWSQGQQLTLEQAIADALE